VAYAMSFVSRPWWAKESDISLGKERTALIGSVQREPHVPLLVSKPSHTQFPSECPWCRQKQQVGDAITWSDAVKISERQTMTRLEQDRRPAAMSFQQSSFSTLMLHRFRC